VFCHLDSLRRCLPGRVRLALDELPATLDGTYERTLLDINEENWAYAHRLFQCITVASRPLRVEELAEFLAFDLERNLDQRGDPRFDADWRPEDSSDAVLSTCSSLITVVNVGDTTVVQFSHFSVKEFLTSHRIARGRVSRYHIPLEPAHLTIARACLTVLLHLDDSVNKATTKNFPLAFYAARYWIDHAKVGNVSLHTRDAIRQVFDPTRPYFSAWAWLECYDKTRGSIPEKQTTPRYPPLHRAALDDLDDVAGWLITSRSQDPDEHDRYNTTPFYYASSRGNLKVAQLLIEHGADVNAQCVSSLRPLHIASTNGRLEILRLLVRNGADVNALVSGVWTALHLASKEGHLEVVRVLLENGADPNLLWWTGTPLSEALRLNHLEVAQLLLQYDADINARDGNGSTLLHKAVFTFDPKSVRQLLERGAYIHARDGKGKTALQLARVPAPETRRQQTADIIQLLLQHGAEVPMAYGRSFYRCVCLAWSLQFWYPI
jgi:ankyrin repeat protein